MKIFYYILLFSILFSGCTNETSQIEKDYIKSLEHKNKLLQQELSELNASDTVNESKTSKKDLKKSLDYFKIGSTEDDVINVMGNPTSYMQTAPEAKKFLYGYSSVYFYQGKVISYDNLEDNLKVKVK